MEILLSPPVNAPPVCVKAPVTVRVWPADCVSVDAERLIAATVTGALMTQAGPPSDAVSVGPGAPLPTQLLPCPKAVP